MATKVCCDICDAPASNKFQYLVHLDAPGKIGYADRNDNPISGVLKSVDLCNLHYNLVVGPAVEAMKALVKPQEKGKK